MYEKAAEGVIPANTKSSTNWDVRTFKALVEERNLKASDDPVPLDLLEKPDADKLCMYMRLFVLEARKEDGQPYPPSTLRGLLSGLNRVLKQNKATFFDYEQK